MSTRRILYGLCAMVAIFLVGALIGGVWDDSDAAGAITVTLWIISIVGAVLLVIALVASRLRRSAA